MAITTRKNLLTSETNAKVPEISLEGNRIARAALYPTSEQTAENATSAAKLLQSGADAAATGVIAAVTPTTAQKKSSTGNTGTAQPTNPYATQMEQTLAAMNAPKPTYTDSYADRIAQMEAEGPAAYTSKYQTNIDGLLDKLQNREAFQYNLSEDPLYRQLAAQYIANGKRAMQDTMGTAAGLTGGYGSSYASTAGNQAYQQQLNQLNDKAIDLYTLARQNYDADGDAMRSNLNALQTAESMDRSNYESDRADYYNRLAALRDSQATEYQRYTDQLSLRDTEQQRAWEQYKYWNDLWESEQ